MDDLVATAAIRVGNEDFRMGAVFVRAFGILRRNAFLFVPLCSVAGLPDLIVSARAGAQGWVANASTQLLQFVLGSLVQAMVVYAAFEDMRGRKIHFGKSLSIGIRRFSPVIIASIVIEAAVGLGLLLLAVPGLIALASLYVTICACIVEKRGPFESVARSAALTKSHRAKVLGIAALPLLAVAIGEEIIETALLPRGGSILVFVWQAFFTAYDAVLAVVTYHDLRRAKEGVDADQIVAVFE